MMRVGFFLSGDKKIDGKNIEGQTLYLLFLSFGQQIFVPSLSPEAFRID